LITTTEPVTTRSFWVLFYRAAVDLSRSTLNYVAGIVRRHRKAIGSAWRLLTPGIPRRRDDHRHHALQGPQQAGTPKTGEPIPRQASRAGERANAQIKTWRLLHKLRCSPSKAGHLVKAIAVLQNYEITRG
jgi:hypothetical protein